jgi:hypothetical protein
MVVPGATINILASLWKRQGESAFAQTRPGSQTVF